MRLLLLGLFFLSGATALSYELTWTRMLTQLLGGSASAVTAVVTAYMLGLSLGAWRFGRRADATDRPVLLYARLELALAGWAAIFPVLVGLAEAFYAASLERLLPSPGLLTAVRFGLALALLLLPTTLMGGTFPVLVRGWVTTRSEVGLGGGLLYAANTLGAVVGCLAPPFALFGVVGIRGTCWLTSAANLLLGLAALAIGDRIVRPAEDAAPPTPAPAPRTPHGTDEPASDADAAPAGLPLYLAVFVSGAGSLVYELLWTRMMTAVAAGITYTFAAVLAAYLAALAVGAAVAAFVADRVRARLRLLGIFQIAGGLAALASIHAFHWTRTVPGTIRGAFGGDGWWTYVEGLFLDAVVVVGPPTLLLGAVLPLACRIASDRGDRLGSRIGALYAVNTLGAVLGPVVATYGLLPSLRSLQYALLVPVLCTLASGVLVVASDRKKSLVATAVAGAAAMCGFAALSLELGPAFAAEAGAGTGDAGRTPPAVSISGDLDTPFPVAFGPLREINRVGSTLLHFETGPSTTVTVVQDPEGWRLLYTDSFVVAGTGAGYGYMPMLGHLPALLAAERRRALVVGFGTGTTAGALSLHPFERIDIVELCPEVPRAAAKFAEVNHGVLERRGPGPAVRLVIEDGRNFLRASGEKYDVITAEPPLPYLAGGSTLYTREFYEGCRARLADGGLVIQWLPIHVLRPDDFRVLARTFLEVFPESTLWYFRSAGILVGGNRPLRIDYAELERRLDPTAAAPIRKALRGCGIATQPLFLAAYVCGPEALRTFARRAAVLTEDRPFLEFYGHGSAVSEVHRQNVTEMISLRESVLPRVGNFGEPAAANAARSELQKAGLVAERVMQGNVELLDLRLDAAEIAYRAALAIFLDDPGVQELLRECTQIRERYRLPSDPSLAVSPPSGAAARTEKPPEPGDVRRKLASAEPREREEGLRAALRLPAAGDLGGRVLELLQDPDKGVRIWAIVAAGKFELQDAVPRLLQLFEERTEDSSIFALGSLVALGFPESREKMEILLRDRTPAVRLHALQCLGAFRKQVDWTGLDRFLEDPDPEVKKVAFRILGDLGEAKWVPSLARRLSDADWQTRAAAVAALAGTRSPEAAPALFGALGDEDSFVRRKAAEALVAITGAAMPFDADADPAERTLQARVWRETWERRR